MSESGSRSLLIQFKAGLNKWRLFFLVFALIYAVLVLLDFANAPIQWDEAVHLNNGLFLFQEEYARFNYFYPPLFDVATMFFFKVFGVTVLSARLVSVTFSLLSLWIVFELAYRMYGAKNALTASILVGLFPAYFWLSRLALIETMLVFFFTVSLFFFFIWLRSPQKRTLVLNGLMLGLRLLDKIPNTYRSNNNGYKHVAFS
jgi:4-amino-4-deoxy-L-arabinose transferase-like glycosyltransferase